MSWGSYKASQYHEPLHWESIAEAKGVTTLGMDSRYCNYLHIGQVLLVIFSMMGHSLGRACTKASIARSHGDSATGNTCLGFLGSNDNLLLLLAQIVAAWVLGNKTRRRKNCEKHESNFNLFTSSESLQLELA
jgi:hypothetical protein